MAGGGITRLAAFVANPYIAAGQLEQLFVPDQRSDVIAEVEPLDFYLCVRDRYQLTPKVRAFMDFLVTACRQSDVWSSRLLLPRRSMDNGAFLTAYQEKLSCPSKYQHR